MRVLTGRQQYHRRFTKLAHPKRFGAAGAGRSSVPDRGLPAAAWEHFLFL